MVTWPRKFILAFALMAGIAPAMAQVPPPVPGLPDTERRTSYSLNASTCTCSVGFALYGDSTDYQNWVEVWVNGAIVGNWTITSPTGPLASIPRPITDAVLTFATPQTGTVQIVGARRPRRTSQFSENQGVSARNLNQALTDIVAQNRETWDKINDVTGRAIVAPPGETLPPLPPASMRTGNVLGFDSNGYPILVPPPLTGVTGSTGSPIDVTTLGVLADASTVYNSAHATINGPIISAAIASGQCIMFPYNANGYSIPANTITISTGQCIANFNQILVKSQPGSGQWVFHITSFNSSDDNKTSYIDNLIVDTTGASSGSTVFRYATSAASVDQSAITRIICLNAYECIGDETSAASYVLDIKWSDVRSVLPKGRSFHISRSRGFMWLDTVRVDQQETGQTVAAAWNCAEFDDFIGLEINRFDCVGPTTTLGGSYQTGFYGLKLVGNVSGGQASVWLNRILIDSYENDGIDIENVNFLQGNWVEVFQALGSGLTLKSVNNANFSNTMLIGASGLSGASSTATGLTCNPCTNTNFGGVVGELWTGQGISFTGASSGVALSNFQIYGNTLFNVSISGTSDFVSVSQGSASGGGSGQISDTSSGTHNVVHDVSGYNPVGSNAATNVGTSPANVCAGDSPATDYLFQSATNTATVQSGSHEIAVLSAVAFYPVNLVPHECYTVTWATTQPTYTRVVH